MADLISREAVLAILHECGGDEITPPNMIEMRGRMHRLHAVDAVPISDVYRLIAGHSNYHGDNILAALTCVAEGKEVKPIRPIDPAVDAVEVVRCRECIHCALTEDGEYDPQDIVCEWWATDGLNATDFCSYGERREENAAD